MWEAVKESIFFNVPKSSHFLSIYHHRPDYFLKLFPFILTLNGTYFSIVASFSKCAFQIVFLSIYSAVLLNVNVMYSILCIGAGDNFICKSYKKEDSSLLHNKVS